MRVTRRGGGIEAHAAHATRLRWMRAGVALALVGPLAVFCLSYMLRGGSKDGIIVTLIDGAIYGTIDLVECALAEPLDALLYLTILAAADHFSFRA